MRTHTSVPLRVALAAILLVLGPGCSTWVGHPLSPAAALRQPAPSYWKVRLVRTHGEPLVVRNPTVVGDSVFGMRVEPNQPRQPIAVPLAEVREVQTIRADVAETAALVTGIVAAAFLGLLHLISQTR